MKRQTKRLQDTTRGDTLVARAAQWAIRLLIVLLAKELFVLGVDSGPQKKEEKETLQPRRHMPLALAHVSEKCAHPQAVTAIATCGMSNGHATVMAPQTRHRQYNTRTCVPDATRQGALAHRATKMILMEAVRAHLEELVSSYNGPLARVTCLGIHATSR